MINFAGNNSSGREQLFRDVRSAYAKLEEWIFSRNGAEEDLSEIETDIECQGRELERLLLQSHINNLGDGCVGKKILVRETGWNGPVIYSRKRHHTRVVRMLFGEITFRRIAYISPGRTTVRPLDVALALPELSFSCEFQKRLVRRSVQGPYDEVVTYIQEATGAGVSKRSAEKILIKSAEDFDRFYLGNDHASRYQSPSSSILVAAVDCKGIPMVKDVQKPFPEPKKIRKGKGEKNGKKKMATVGTVYTTAPRFRTPESVVESLFKTNRVAKKEKNNRVKPENKRVWASLRMSKDEFIGDVKKEMDSRDAGKVKKWVVVTDGERALQMRTEKKIPGAVYILDLLHVLEKLWKVAHAFYGEGSDSAVEYVRSNTLKILHGQVGQVCKGIRIRIKKNGFSKKKIELMNSVIGYLRGNKKRMNYNKYLKNGYPIASGSVEGACKNLIKDRMERSGMRWSEEGAESMVKMRAVYLSGDFDDYWKYHVSAEQGRLYSKISWELYSDDR